MICKCLKVCTMLLYKVLIFATIFAAIEADTPANCTFEDVQGIWTFYVGENGHDNTLNCDSSFKVVTELRVHLLFPDVALDDDYNRGFWTMIYNQGFEVVLNGTKYFAFSKYINTVSYCDQTLPGWHMMPKMLVRTGHVIMVSAECHRDSNRG